VHVGLVRVVGSALAEQAPGAGGVQAEVGRPRVADDVGQPAAAVPGGGTLHQGLTGGGAHDVQPGQHRAGQREGRLHQVLPVQRGDPGREGQRREQHRDVRVADEPGRLGPAQRVEVQQGQQVDRELAAPGRDDGGDRGVAQQGGQLGGALAGRGRHDPGPVQALAEHDAVPGLAQEVHGVVEPGPEDVRDTRGGCRDGDPVAGAQRSGVAHAASLPAPSPDETGVRGSIPTRM
jgi:hypothetical protein